MGNIGRPRRHSGAPRSRCEGVMTINAGLRPGWPGDGGGRVNASRCLGRTVHGRRCRNRTRPEAPYCPWHDPARRQPVEAVGGPLDGERIGLSTTQRDGVLYLLYRPRDNAYYVAAASGYWPHVHAGGDPAIRGRYRLQYDAHACPFWIWERAASVKIGAGGHV